MKSKYFHSNNNQLNENNNISINSLTKLGYFKKLNIFFYK